MAKSSANSRRATPLSADEAKALVDLMDAAFENFGAAGLIPPPIIDDLEQAIGMYMIGRHLGWKVLVLVHNKRTIRKFENIVGVPIREMFPEEGPAADRSLGYKFAKSLSNFWKAVSGEVSVPNRRQIN